MSSPNPRSWLGTLGVGCGLVAFAAISLVGLSARVLLAQVDSAAGACAAFVRDVREGDHASARRRMSAEYQREFDDEHLRESAARIEPLTEQVSALVSSTERTDDSHVSVGGTLFGSFGTAPFACDLSEHAGYWYIDLVVVRGQPLE